MGQARLYQWIIENEIFDVLNSKLPDILEKKKEFKRETTSRKTKKTQVTCLRENSPIEITF